MNAPALPVAARARYPDIELLSRAALHRAVAADAAWRAIHADACAVYGAGSLVSAIGNAENAPASIKDELRALARASGSLTTESLALWRLAGRTRSTWLRVKDAILYPPARYTAESYSCARVDGSTESGWCVKDGDDTVCDVHTEAEAVRVAALLNGAA